MLKKSLVLCFIISCNRCTYKASKIEDVFLYLENKYTVEFVVEFKNTPEEDILKKYYSPFMSDYSSVSKDVRAISEIFEPVGIYNTRDRAYVTLIAWHRKLNSKPLRLEELLQEVTNKYEAIISCVKKKNANAVANFQKLNLGDTVTLNIPVRVSDGLKSTIYYDCPTYDWEFNENKDLKIIGILTEKFSKSGSEEFFIKLIITCLNRSDTRFFFEEIKPLDTIQISLNAYGLPIERL